MGVSPSISSSPLRTVLLDADAKSEIRERRKSKIYVGSCRRNCLPVVPEPPLLVSLLLLFLPPSVFKDDTDIIADSFSRRSICSFSSPYLPHRRRTFSRAGGQSVTPCHSPAVRGLRVPLGLSTARRLLRQSDTASFPALASMHSNSIGRRRFVVVASKKTARPPPLDLSPPPTAHCDIIAYHIGRSLLARCASDHRLNIKRKGPGLGGSISQRRRSRSANDWDLADDER